MQLQLSLPCFSRVRPILLLLGLCQGPNSCRGACRCVARAHPAAHPSATAHSRHAPTRIPRPPPRCRVSTHHTDCMLVKKPAMLSVFTTVALLLLTGGGKAAGPAGPSPQPCGRVAIHHTLGCARRK